jgi:hypothetical protein
MKQIICGLSHIPLVFGIEHDESRLAVHKVYFHDPENEAQSDVVENPGNF